MEYVLLGALLVGVLLFLAGWLAVVIKGFQRHAVTRVFALIPVLNVVTLPSLWHRVSGWVMVGFVGFLLAIGAWLGGAPTQLQQQAKRFGLGIGAPPAAVAVTANTPAPSVKPTVATASNALTTTALSLPPAQPQTAAPVNNTTVPVQSTPPTAVPVAQTPETASSAIQAQALPSKALYHMVFEALPLDKVGDNTGSYLRIVQKDGKRREGKLQNVTNTEITVEEREEGGVKSQTFKLNELREVFILRNQQNQE